MNYKIYEKIEFISIGMTYICLLFKVDIIFENFLASVFSFTAAIACRIYYTKRIRVLCKMSPRTEEVEKNISKSVGMSWIGPILLGGLAVFFFTLGVYNYFD